MTPKERAAMQQALEALESAPVQYDFNSYPMLVMSPETIEITLAALREALAEQADGEQWSPDDMAYRPSGLSMEQTEQEPVAWVDLEQWQSGEYDCFTSEKVAEYMTPLYATPVRTKDLTDDEIRKTTRDEKIVRPGVYEVSVEQAEQEPIYISESCAERGCACHYSVEVDGEPVAVYSAPVRTKDLTDDELWDLWNTQKDIIGVMRAVIAADREKNNVK